MTVMMMMTHGLWGIPGWMSPGTPQIHETIQIKIFISSKIIFYYLWILYFFFRDLAHTTNATTVQNILSVKTYCIIWLLYHDCYFLTDLCLLYGGTIPIPVTTGYPIHLERKPLYPLLTKSNPLIHHSYVLKDIKYNISLLKYSLWSDKHSHPSEPATRFQWGDNALYSATNQHIISRHVHVL